MRAWNLTAALLLVAACGGSDASDDSGLGDSGTNDVTSPLDGSTNDVTVADGATNDGAANDGTTTLDATGPFDPSQLAGLALWLDGAKGVTQANGAVTAWADQTTNHNDATGGSGQTAHQPTINMTAINNLPAVQFATTQNTEYLQIADSASLQWGTADFAVFMVAEYSNPTQNAGAGQGQFYGKILGNTSDAETGPNLLGNGGGTNNTYVGVVRGRISVTDAVDSTAANYNDGKFHRIGLRRNGAALEVWTDGVATSLTPDAGANIDVSSTTADVFIGASVTPGVNINQPPTISLRLIGGIAEVIGVKGTITSGDTTNLDAYFKTKYALQ